MLGVIWVFRWKEIEEFLKAEGAGVKELWVRVRFRSALWASVSLAFKDYRFFCIMMDWRAAA